MTRDEGHHRSHGNPIRILHRRLRRTAAPIILGLLGTIALAGAQEAGPAGDPGNGEARGQGTALVPATMVLHWSPQAQFAGYYVAMNKGFYRERGVDLTLIDGGPRVDGLGMLRDGEADFATLFLTGALEGVEDGVPLRLVSQIVNESLVLLVARKKAGIREVEDLAGRRVSVWAREDIRAPFEIFFAEHDIRVEAVPQYHSVDLFLMGGVDACAAMLYNEYHQLFLAGMEFEELTVFPVQTGPLELPEDGIYARPDFLEAHPDAARAVAEASMEGWRWAAEHPEEALDIVMERVRSGYVPVSRVHMRWMLETILPAILQPESEEVTRIPGQLAEADFRHTVELLTAAGVLRDPPPLSSFLWEGGG